MPEHTQSRQPLRWLPMAFFVIAILCLIGSLSSFIIASGESQRLASATIPTAADDVHMNQLERQIAELSAELERKTAEMSEMVLNLNALNADLTAFAKPSNLPKLIKVDGTVYHIWGIPYDHLIDLDKVEATGRITSIIAQSLPPVEDDQTNFDCEGQPYVWIDGDLYLKLKNHSWYRCSPY